MPASQSNAVVGTATVIKVGNGLNGASGSYTTIAEVKDIDWGFTRNIIDVTSHDSGGWKEKRPGVKDAGQVSFELNFLPQNATQSFSAGLMADFIAGNLRDYEIIWSDSGNTVWKFTAIVKDYQPKGPVDAALTAKITLEITGTPTLT
jgi:predicted secreted protein